MKEFSTVKGWKIFVLIFAPFMLGIFGLLIHFILSVENMNWILLISSLAICFVCILLLLYGVLDTLKSKVIFTNDRIIKINLFERHELLFEQVEGIKIGENYVHIYPKLKTLKKISISLYYGNKNELSECLHGFTDLGLKENVEEINNFYLDEKFGITQEERDKKIAQAKTLANAINVISFLVTFWIMFFPEPYYLSIVIGVLLPITALFLIYKSNGLITLTNEETSPNPSLSTPLYIPIIALGLRVISDYSFLEYQKAWYYTVCFLPLIYFSIRRKFYLELAHYKIVEKISANIIIIILIGVQVFTTTLILNCTFDYSTPVTQDATIKSKRESEYFNYVILESLDSLIQGKETTVITEVYNSVEEGDIVYINIKKGLFNIPWFYVTSKK